MKSSGELHTLLCPCKGEEPNCIYLSQIINFRNSTLDDVAKMAEYHSGPSIQLAERILSLKETL
jgi:hypothetical protein